MLSPVILLLQYDENLQCALCSTQTCLFEIHACSVFSWNTSTDLKSKDTIRSDAPTFYHSAYTCITERVNMTFFPVIDSENVVKLTLKILQHHHHHHHTAITEFCHSLIGSILTHAGV
jgi:hypothetical protein